MKDDTFEIEIWNGVFKANETLFIILLLTHIIHKIEIEQFDIIRTNIMSKNCTQSIRSFKLLLVPINYYITQTEQKMNEFIDKRQTQFEKNNENLKKKMSMIEALSHFVTICFHSYFFGSFHFSFQYTRKKNTKIWWTNRFVVQYVRFRCLVYNRLLHPQIMKDDFPTFDCKWEKYVVYIYSALYTMYLNHIYSIDFTSVCVRSHLYRTQNYSINQ